MTFWFETESHCTITRSLIISFDLMNKAWGLERLRVQISALAVERLGTWNWVWEMLQNDAAATGFLSAQCKSNYPTSSQGGKQGMTWSQDFFKSQIKFEKRAANRGQGSESSGTVCSWEGSEGAWRMASMVAGSRARSECVLTKRMSVKNQGI